MEDARTHKYTCLLTYLLTHSRTLTHSHAHTHSHTITLTHTNSHSLTQILTPWSTVLLENLTGSQLVKKFTTFYGIRRLITALTIARHLSLSSARSIQSIIPHPTSRRPIFNIILPSRPVSSKWYISSVNAFNLSHTCYVYMPRAHHFEII